MASAYNDSNSVATPATSRISNTSASSAKRKPKKIMSIKENAQDEERLEQMLQDAELLAARMRSTASSSNGSSAEHESAREASMSVSKLDASYISEELLQSEAVAAPPMLSPQRSRTSFILSEDCSTPSRSQQDQVEAAIHSSKLMKKALLALSQSQQDLALLPDDAEDKDDDQSFVTTGNGHQRTPAKASSVNHESVVWDRADFAQEGDDDYVPMADYSRGGASSAQAKSSSSSTKQPSSTDTSNNKKPFTTNAKKTNNVVTPETPPAAASYIDRTSGITWHKVESPTHDDDDYVPLADYSKQPNATSSQNSPNDSDDAFDNESTMAFSPLLSRQQVYRRKTALQRKKRNKWIRRILVVLLMMVAICFVFGLMAGDESTTEKASETRPQQEEANPTSPLNAQEEQATPLPVKRPLQVESIVTQLKEKLEATPIVRSSAEETDTLVEEAQPDTAEASIRAEPLLEAQHTHTEPTKEQEPITPQLPVENVPQHEKKDHLETVEPEPVRESILVDHSEPVSSNGAKDGPCDTLTALVETSTAIELNSDNFSAKGACKMAFADWFLPVCRQARIAGEMTKSDREDMVHALVQSMMQ